MIEKVRSTAIAAAPGWKNFNEDRGRLIAAVPPSGKARSMAQPAARAGKEHAMKSRYVMFAAYNRWANERLYEAAAALTDDDYRADRGAFFKSVHGTLNHLLVGDRIWMARFTGTGDAPDRLDAILHESFAPLRTARRAEDARIVDYVEGLSEQQLAGRVRYRTVTNPRTIEQDLAPALDHFFNHQTHHRGQAHCLLTAISGDAPSLDLILFQREANAGAA
jgi:uncharacterized damage-inducible protein DinB